MEYSFKLGRGKEDLVIHGNMLNRHGLISGASGSGKTVTLKVMAENISKMGVPVILTDIKGDLASLSMEGIVDEDISKRIEKIGFDDYETRTFPVELFDIYGESGIPLRTTISEMGPILLSKLLGLNDIQKGVLNICFIVADEKQYFLHDIKDLRAMLNYLYDNRQEYERKYGNISKATIGAILRSLTVIENEGGDKFFSQPSFEIEDFLNVKDGMGVINIIDGRKLYNKPTLYSTYLIWILSELYEKLPEVGDLDKPKLVFFFDEAHAIFNDSEVEIKDQFERMIRMVRSKGIGIFFVTQDPLDIPEGILNQLGNKIQHQLRANTPKELKKVKDISDTYKQDGSIDVKEAIVNLEKGEALCSVLDENGESKYADIVTIAPPESFLGNMDSQKILKIVNNSNLLEKYQESIELTSAYEILMEIKNNEIIRAEEKKELDLKEKEQAELLKQKEKELKELEKKKQAKEKEIEKKLRESSKRRGNSLSDSFTKNVIGSMGREIGRQFSRGVLGIFKKDN